MESILQDILYGLRALARRPMFTAAAVAMLAVGIGANTAIFSVVHAVVLAPLPYDAPDELYTLGSHRNDRLSSYSAPEIVSLRERSRAFVDVSSWNEEPLNLVGSGDPERIQGSRISATLLPLLGVEPLLGRGFTADEEVYGNDTVALLGEGAWRRRFGGRADAVGRTLQLNGRTHTIVGVVPDVFPFMDPGIELYVPLAFTEHELDNPGAHFLLAVGRLAPGMSEDAALAATDALMVQATSELSEDHRGGHGASAVPLHGRLVRDHSRVLWVLSVAVGFVLLIACANVASLLLARASERRRELSVRAAMGAGRTRLVRQLLTESLLLAGMGGAGGLLVALWSVDLVVRLSPSDVPRLDTVAIDWTTFGFVAALSLVAGAGFGLIPALRASSSRIERALHDTARGDGDGSHGAGSKNALVALEVALALVLLTGAGLTLRSFWAIANVSPGFNPDSLVTAQLFLPDSRYEESAAQVDFARNLLERLESLPGTTDAAVISPLPLSDSAWSIAVQVPGRPETEDDSLSANWRTITPGYFKTMGIPLLAGRDLGDSDMRTVESGGRSVVVVNESFAREIFPGVDPLGELVVVGYNDIVCEIVGVVGDVQHRDLTTPPGAEMYTAFAATPLSQLSVAIRTQSDPVGLSSSIREAVWAVDPQQPVYAIEAMPALVTRTLGPHRFVMTLLAVFASVALFLSALGVYAVMSYAVVRRTTEIGIRVAIGATSREVLTMILAEGAKTVFVGTIAGLGASLVLSRFLSSQLYGISATDLSTYVIVSAVLLIVALAAMAIPAYRASNQSPLAALRSD